MAHVTIKDARILFRNFRGRPEKFTPEGKRTFSVILPEDLANELREDGWNVKQLRPREDEEEGSFYIPVEASYRIRPPRIFTITGSGRKTLLDENMVSMLDYAEIQRIDLTLSPYHWSMPSGASGVKAYLRSMFVTLVEDELEEMYSDPSDDVPLPDEPDFDDPF